jgi:uncharacterized membrane protein YfcA
MIYASIAITSLIASFLTFFSGFGLGTILLPVFAIYYPLPIAIALTACVHLLNNVFKLGLVYKSINWNLVLKFGLPSTIAAFGGAYLLKQLDSVNLGIYSYTFNSKIVSITWQGLIIGIVIILFSIVELSKKLSSYTFDKKYLSVGGLLSGFFGGFSGHQGAIRSAFLLRLNLEKQTYIATGVTVACMVDVVRLALYSNFSELKSSQTNYKLLALAVLSAWIGAFVGNKLFKKTSLQFFKWFVGVFMLVMGVLIAIGVVN